MAKQMCFEVIPTYSCGSPAMVDEQTARRVAEDERRGYEATLEGVYGEERQAFARQRGLGNIVYAWVERGASKLEIEDLLTGDKITRKGTFPPRRGRTIFNLHPDEAKKGMVVLLPGGKAHLIEPNYNRVGWWLARVERDGKRPGPEEIDVTQGRAQ